MEVPGVDHGDVVGFHLNAGEETGVGFFAVPGQFEDGPSPFGFVLHRGVLQVPDVELPDASVGTYRGEDVPLLREVDIVDLLVVGDELGEDSLLFDVPDCAGGVD